MSDEVVAPVPAVIEQNTLGVVWVLSEALARHSLNGVYCLGCDWQMPSLLSSWEDQHRLHQASVVAALPNIAIVSTIRGDWAPGRWWRVIAPDGSLWCETSDEQEARTAVRDGDVIERLFDGPQLREWRAAGCQA